MSLTEARRALRENDWRALAAHLQDREIAAVMTKGVSLLFGTAVRVEDDCEVARRGSSAAERAAYGWTLARAAGLLDDCVELEAYVLYRSDEPITSLSCIEGLPKLSKLNCEGSDLGLFASLPSLRTLSVREDAQPAERLADLRTLRELELRARSREVDTSASRAALLDAAASLPLETLTLDGCTAEDLARVAKIRTLRSLRITPPYKSAALADLEPLRGHPALRSLTIGSSSWAGALDAEALATIATLEVVDIERPVRSLDWVKGTPRLRTLNAEAAPDLVPLSGALALEELRIKQAVPDLTPLASLVGLRVLELSAARGAAVLGGLTRLVEATLDVGDADFATLEALGGIPALDRLSLTPTAALRPFPVRALRFSGRCRAFVQAFRAARLPRALPVVETLSKADTAALRALNTAFKAAKVSRDALPAIQATPRDALARICAHAGLRVGEDGALAWNEQGLRFPKVTQESELLLALADAVGLLDGLTYVCVARPAHLNDLGALKRHARTLAWMYVEATHYGVSHGDDEVWVDGEVREKLDGVAPFPVAAEAAAEEGVPENLLALLRSSDLAGVRQGADLAATLGHLDALLEGCGYLAPQANRNRPPSDTTWFVHARLVPPCPGCSGTGRRGAGKCGACDGGGTATAMKGEHAERIVKALLTVAPRGSEVAATVTRAVTHLDLVDGTDVPWLHHARALESAEVSWEVVRDHVDTLAALPALRELTFVASPDDPDAALALLQRLRQVTTFCFDGGAPLSLLTGLGSIRVTHAVVERV